MLNTSRYIAFFSIVLAVFFQSHADHHKKKPLEILLIAGGCCHDYQGQAPILKAALEEKINSKVTIDLDTGKTGKEKFKSYIGKDWAKKFDLVIHDECTAKITDPEYVNNILNAHKNGTPAVNLHCAMHSYRWGDYKKPVSLDANNAKWFEMIGVQSPGHGPKKPIQVKYEKIDHPITKGLSDWTTGNEELYKTIQVFDQTTILAMGTQEKSKAAVVWTNLYGPNKTRIFSTSLGHFTETVADIRYIDLVTNGALWAMNKLDKNGHAKEGYGVKK